MPTISRIRTTEKRRKTADVLQQQAKELVRRCGALFGETYSEDVLSEAASKIVKSLPSATGEPISEFPHNQNGLHIQTSCGRPIREWNAEVFTAQFLAGESTPFTLLKAVHLAQAAYEAGRAASKGRT